MTPQLPIQINGDNYEPMDLDIMDHHQNQHNSLQFGQSSSSTASALASSSEERDELVVLNDVNLDLESFVSHYRGLPLIQRLEFIADHCISLRVDALLLAIQYIKENTHNVRDYQRLYKKLTDTGYKELQLDNEWIDTKTKQAGLRFDCLDTELKNFRQNSMKENIRRSQDDLAEHYLDCGDLENAFNAYSKSRDYLLNNKTQINQCLNMIRVSVLLKRWSSVSSHHVRAESQQFLDNTPMLPSIPTKLHCAAGLYELSSKRYKRAAKHFLSTNIDHFDRRQTIYNRSDKQTARGSGQSVPKPGPSSGRPTTSGMINYGAGKSSPDQVPGNMGYWEILAPVNIAVW